MLTARPHKMKVLIFGATGMVGQGVLRECLLAPDIEFVETVGRTATQRTDSKLKDLVHSDLLNYATIESRLREFDACFFCLGISSAGMTEVDYDKVTYGIATAAAQALYRLNPAMTFIFVSGAGADSSEKGRIMWARVKGRTENAILHMPFKGAYIFRPAIIQPLANVQSKTAAYRIAYKITGPLLPLLRRLFPRYILTTEEIGQAMIDVAQFGAPKKVLESADIRECATSRQNRSGRPV